MILILTFIGVHDKISALQVEEIILNTEKMKQLEMIQAIIVRMAQNSFWVKGVTVTLTSAILIFYSDLAVSNLFSLIIILPIVGFALFDAFYLQLERRYRCLYNKNRKKDNLEIDFDLSPPQASVEDKTTYIKCVFSKSILMFYPVVIAIVILAYFVLPIQ